MKAKVTIDTVHLRELYLAGKPGTWEVQRGGTAYYPIVISCDGENVISFHSWDTAAARKAAAIAELHNAIPALLHVAEMVKVASPSVRAADCPLVPVKLQELTLFLAELPQAPWHVRPQCRLFPAAVLSEPNATVVDFTSFEPWTAAVSALLVVMHQSMPNLLEIASAVATLDVLDQHIEALSVGTRFKLAVPLRVYAEGCVAGGAPSEEPSATETDIPGGTELEILGLGKPRFVGDDLVNYCVRVMGGDNRQFELVHSALAPLGYQQLEDTHRNVAE